MCEANAYMLKTDEEELVMEAVDSVEPAEGGLKLVSIFGEQKFLNAVIYSLDLQKNKIYLKNM